METLTDEMVEAAALALYADTHRHRVTRPEGWAHMPSHHQDEWRRKARLALDAALTAPRERD